jgi:DNA-binding transcriptional regulator YhcF (GntR family)
MRGGAEIYVAGGATNADSTRYLWGDITFGWNMAARLDLTRTTRDRIVAAMHLGHLRPGDRLETMRELARELGVDHRAVAAAYRELEAEGLVEIRGRAGVFLAQQRLLGGQMTGEMAEWLADVLTEARRRRIGIPQFPDFVARATGGLPLKVACIESNEDTSSALCTELAEEFGLEALPLRAEQFPASTRRSRTAVSPYPPELGEVHLMVTTAFHAHQVRPAAEFHRKPLIVVTLNEEMARIVERRLQAGRPLTVLVVDAAFGERLRALYARVASPDLIRLVLASDHGAIARLDRSDAVLATRAARRLLPDLDLPLLLPRFPSISLDSTRELAGTIIRHNLEPSAG